MTTKYVISISHGNDSLALVQWAHDNCLDLFGEVVVAYCNTGWAKPSWRERVEVGKNLCERLGYQYIELSSMGMHELVRMKKGWPGNGQQFCTMHLKGVPFLDWIDEWDKERTATVLIGKRREESEARKDAPEFIECSEYHGDRRVWHPLYMHTKAMRDELLNKAGVEILPHRSDECSPCVNANRGDILRLGADELAKVNSLEVEIGKPMFRPKRFNGLGIYGVVMWAKFGKNHEADVPDDGGCGSAFGCGL